MLNRVLILCGLLFSVQSALAGVCEISETEFGDGTTFVKVFIVSKDGQEVHRTIYQNEAQRFARDAEVCGGSGLKEIEPYLQAGMYKGRNSVAWVWKECEIEIHNSEDGKPRVISVRDSDSIYNLWLVSEVVYEVPSQKAVVGMGKIGFDAFYKGIRKNVYSTSIEQRPDAFTLIVNRDEELRPTSFKFRYISNKKTSEIICELKS